MKTEPRQGFPICQKCKDGEMVLFGKLLALPPINIFKCDMCGYEQQEKRLKTEEILNEREKTHGDFDECASLAYDMKKVIDFHLAMDRKGPDDNNKIIKKTHLIAINMILLKIARIICGNPNHADHWDDIAGYAMLGKGKQEAKTTEWVSIKDDKPQVGRLVEVKGKGWAKKNAKMYCCLLGCFWEYPCIEDRIYLSDSFVTHWRYINDDETAEKEEPIIKEIKSMSFEEFEKEYGFPLDKEGKEGKECDNEEKPNHIDPSFLLNKLKTWLEMLLGPRRAPEYRSRTLPTEKTEKEVVADFFQQAIEKLDNSLNELKNKYPHLFQEKAKYSTSSKMEHVPKCDRCGEECETTCFTIKDIDLNKRFCPKCTGEIAGEACRQEMERMSEKKGGCTKSEPGYSVGHMFSCQYKLSGCDCVSFCKIKAGYKT